MNDLTLIAVVLSIVISNILCFTLGARMGLKTTNNEPIRPMLPKIKNPMDIYKEKEEQKEYERAIEDIRKSIENIDNYGSDKPQQLI